MPKHFLNHLPNILIIYTDQQRYNTIHHLGNEHIQTPNLDKLAMGGVAFTHAFAASPVCLPSRWSLHTGMTTMIDDEIGRLIAFLKESELLDNTLIIFTSDHGDYMGDHGMMTKSLALYDCLIRVPLIFYWKGKILNGVISKELTSQVDIMPTILDLINSPIPKQVQGQSYASLLAGKKGKKRIQKYAFAEYGIPGKPITRAQLENPIDYGNGIPWEANPIALSGRIRMIRSHNWKFIEEENGTSELYDLRNDPNELKNLWNLPACKKPQRKLERALRKWKKQLLEIEKDAIPMGEENLKKYVEARKTGKKPATIY